MPQETAPLEASACRVVLVGPENALNVGFVARAMRGFGARELVLAGSAWKSLPPKARVTGVAAPEVLEGARLVPTLAEALRGCDAAIAFSRRPSVLRQKSFALPAVPAALKRPGRTALVFGRESNGLTREESALCPFLARIPCRGGVSLNLGQAVAVALFSLTAEAPRATGAPEAPRSGVALDRLLGLWDFLEPKLAAAPRFTARRLQRLRQMLYGLRLDDGDFDLLFAVMSELALPAAVRRRARTAEKGS
jgi:TrmH family RNA methyltransferase